MTCIVKHTNLRFMPLKSKMYCLQMAWAKRTARDIKDLTENGFTVLNDQLGPDVSNMSSFAVVMQGPTGTSYESYKIHVLFTIPDNFPFSSPSVGFYEKI